VLVAIHQLEKERMVLIQYFQLLRLLVVAVVGKTQQTQTA
jgi:hypothetical protein